MKKSLFILPIFFLFLFVGKAQASTLLDNSGNTTGTENSGCTIYGNADWCKAQGNNVMTFATPTNFGSSSKLSKVKVSVAMDPYSKSHCPTCMFGLKITNAHDDIHTSDNTYHYSDVPDDGYMVFTFNFLGSDTINFADTGNNAELIKKLKSIYLYDAGGPSSGQYWGRPTLGFQFKNDSNSAYLLAWCGSGSTSTCPHDLAPYLVIEDDVPDITRSISWGSDFSQGFVSTDFKFWNACVNIPPQTGNTDTGVFLYADYNTFGGDIGDQITDDSGYLVPFNPAAGYHGCIIFNKSTDLTAGQYQASIKLYTGTGSDPQYFGYKASTDALYFRIIAGTGADLPNNTVANDLGFPENPIVAPQCPQTSFRIFSVDFGKGLCSAVSFLFVPSNDFWTTNNEQTHTILFEQAPFAYFATVQANINSAHSTTGNPETTLAIATPIGNFNMDLFNTSDPLMEIYHDSPIRGWLETFLWIGFATYLFFRAFRFFRPV